MFFCLLPLSIFSVCRASQLDLSVALETIQYLYREDHYVPWTAALDGLLYIGHMLSFSPVFGQFKVSVMSMVHIKYCVVLCGLTMEQSTMRFELVYHTFELTFMCFVQAFVCHLLEPIADDLEWVVDDNDTHVKRHVVH